MSTAGDARDLANAIRAARKTLESGCADAARRMLLSAELRACELAKALDRQRWSETVARSARRPANRQPDDHPPPRAA